MHNNDCKIKANLVLWNKQGQAGRLTIGGKVDMILRKAKLADAEKMHVLLNKYANEGLMLARPRSMIYECIRDFVVAEIDGEIAGTAALHILWEDLAEVRSVAVKEEYKKMGIGKKMVEYCLQEAKELGLPKVFTLTYQPGFFAKLGFQVIGKESLPQKVWKECINCPKFPNCDEICMELNLE